jgi:hypothetical protein
MSVAINIIDSSLPVWQTASDVYHPVLTSFDPVPLNLDHQSIEHIDVVQTWKGITVHQAEELLFWQDGFKRALESIVEEYLIVRLEKAGIPLEFNGIQAALPSPMAFD